MLRRVPTTLTVAFVSAVTCPQLNDVKARFARYQMVTLDFSMAVPKPNLLVSPHDQFFAVNPFQPPNDEVSPGHVLKMFDEKGDRIGGVVQLVLWAYGCMQTTL